jgi:hypothetical protein
MLNISRLIKIISDSQNIYVTTWYKNNVRIMATRKRQNYTSAQQQTLALWEMWLTEEWRRVVWLREPKLPSKVLPPVLEDKRESSALILVLRAETSRNVKVTRRNLRRSHDATTIQCFILLLFASSQDIILQISLLFSFYISSMKQQSPASSNPNVNFSH